MASKTLLVQLTAHFTASSSPILWIHRSGSPELKQIFCLNLYYTKLQPIPASCTLECVRDEAWFRVWSTFCTFSSEAKSAWDMTNNGTEWHDSRCAFQVSMRSPATGKHVPENSKLPNPCICKELQERRLARTHSLPLKSSIEEKRNGNWFRGMTWTAEMGRKLCQVWTWPPCETPTAPSVLALRPCI